MTDLSSKPVAQEDRLRYDSAHWAREADTAAALEQYLRLGDRVYNRTKLTTFQDLAGNVSGKRILDYGGGAGILAIPCAKAGGNVVIVDAEANALRTAMFYAEREGVADRVRVVCSERFPESLKKERFDIVFAKDIVEHVPEDEQLLRDLGACQAAGGLLVLSTQSSRSLTYLIEGFYERVWRKNKRWMGWDQTHVRFYTPTDLHDKLRSAGYRTQRWAGVYIVPYDLLSWFTLLKYRLEIQALHYIDLTLGRVFPFNRFGWNVIVSAVRVQDAGGQL
jgi:2-polyprenyl-6-hydroxyphenyl methylase / 3-demethylubiquinone-9 3-methyltransferase